MVSIDGLLSESKHNYALVLLILSILDVWESQDAFSAFGQTLMPILQLMGVDPGQPEVAEVHNLIQG